MHDISRPTTARRGNTIVLVTAILVLLVIIATAFISRARAVRDISAAQQNSAGRDGRAESIGIDVANEIAGALFAKPVNTSDPFARVDTTVTPNVVVASSSWPRLAPPADAPRYSIDRDVLPLASATNPFPGDGLPDFGYNIAPYETKPWTNWPDFFGAGSPWPAGPGSPNGILTLAANVPVGDSNPYGSPGMGDSRWLRSTEPERIGIDDTGDGVPDRFDFTHWTHLSWLPSANNAWRVIDDISDITNVVPFATDGNNGTIDNMNEAGAAPYAVALPYEQWLPGVIPAGITNAAQFIARRNQWFGNYPNVYRDPAQALPNFFDLSTLGKPTDEFKPGTARNVVSRTFTDTDGDGFTDSFWFLAPTTVDRGIRTIVGVSIVDNGGLLNANVASKFSFNTTAGHTPSDLALVTSVADLTGPGALGVGFFDGVMNRRNTRTQGPNALTDAGTFGPSPAPSYWRADLNFSPAQIDHFRLSFGDYGTQPLSFLSAIGMRTANGFSDSGAPSAGYTLADPNLPVTPTPADPQPRGSFESARERLAYFKISGLDPETPLFGLTPFDTTDEFELRAFHGNNSPFTLSRFEQAVSLYSPIYQGNEANNFQFLRASPMREEADEYLDQLNSRELLVDNRRKLTLFNGARNETAPPWLWPTPYYEETVNYMNPRVAAITDTSDPNYGSFAAANLAEYERQKLKVDLRKPNWSAQDGQAPVRDPFTAFFWRRDLARLLERSLTKVTQDPATGNTLYQSIYGTRQADYQRTLSMIASYVSNIDCASDEAVPFVETIPSLPNPAIRADDDPLVPIPPVPGNEFFPGGSDAASDPFNNDRFYTGMEKQPFIMEVFFGVAYMRSKFNESDPSWQGTDPTGEVVPQYGQDDGEKFVDSTCNKAPLIAVQIANPYDTPINLRDFRVRFFGKDYTFVSPLEYGPNAQYPDGPSLPPATLGRPSTAIVYFAPTVLDDTVPPNVEPNQSTDTGFLSVPMETLFLDFLDLEKGEMQTVGAAVQQADVDGDGLIERVGPYDSRGPLPNFDPVDRTLVFRAASWNETLGTPGTAAFGGRFRNAQRSVELVRVVGVPPLQFPLVVDRFDNDVTGPEVDFAEAVNRLFDDPEHVPPTKEYFWQPGSSAGAPPNRAHVAGVRIGGNDVFMTWVRASRAWAFDVDTWDDTAVPIANRKISATEISPRYVFSAASEPTRVSREIDGINQGGGNVDFKGDIFAANTDPDENGVASGGGTAARWPRAVFADCFNRQVRAKPAFFTNILVVPAAATGQVDAVYKSGTNPLPFVGDGVNQRGTVNIDGTAYEWHTGSKGMGIDPAGGASGWQEIADLDVMQIPFQMSHKDGDFEQIGEVLDVFLWGHVYDGWGGSPTCERTFGEIMLDDDPDSPFYPGTGLYINRLWARLPGELGQDDAGSLVLGSHIDPTSTTLPPLRIPGYQPWTPALPAGIAFLDGLTIDDAGRGNPDRNADNVFTQAPAANGQPLSDGALAEERRFRLAHGFLGRKTPGLVNINTALPETLAALPMMLRLPTVTTTSPPTTPYSHAADAIRSYRDHGYFAAPTPFPANNLMSYADRGLTDAQVTSAMPVMFPAGSERFFPGMRRERGFASIGELLLLARFPTAPVPDMLRGSYSMRWLGIDPYLGLPGLGFNDYDTGYSWSTDRTNPRPRQLPEDVFLAVTPDGILENVPFKPGDEPLGDVEDLNLMFKGISNLVTTRSDVFTVYLRVRQVKQNATTGVWDGTSTEHVIDDSRYVMCVDRSEVNSPSDQPRIVYFQKVP
jgi:hypothetical protein